MAVRLYAGVRHAAAMAAFDWPSGEFNASLIGDGYVPDLEAHRTMAAVPDSEELATVEVAGNQLTEAGWWQCERVHFGPILLTVPFSQVLFWRPGDGLLVLHIGFPAVNPLLPAVARSFDLLFGHSQPGLVRL